MTSLRAIMGCSMDRGLEVQVSRAARVGASRKVLDIKGMSFVDFRLGY